MAGSLFDGIEAGGMDASVSDQVLGEAAPDTALPIEARYLYATLRSTDGALLTFTRRLVVDGGPGLRRLLGRGAEPGEHLLEALPVGRRAASGVDALHRAGSGRLTITSAPDPGGASFSAGIAGDGVSWTESEVLALSGRALGPGLQWQVPGMRYAGWLYEVEGTALGRDVRGIAGADTVWLPAGAVLYGGDPVTASHEVGIWVTFATSFSPGSAEYGHLLVGRDGGIAITCRDGGVAVHRDVTGTAQADGAGAVVDAPGAGWEFTRDPAGAVPESPEDPMVRAEGLVLLRGEQRSPSAWMAALEIPRPA